MRDSMSVRPSGWRIASRAWRSVFQAMARMPGLFVSASINVITAFTASHFYGLYPVSRYLFGPVVVGQALASSVIVLFSIGIAAATVSWLYSWARTEKAEVTYG